MPLLENTQSFIPPSGSKNHCDGLCEKPAWKPNHYTSDICMQLLWNLKGKDPPCSGKESLPNQDSIPPIRPLYQSRSWATLAFPHVDFLSNNVITKRGKIGFACTGKEGRWSTVVKRVFIQEKWKDLNNKTMAEMGTKRLKSEREVADTAEEGETPAQMGTGECADEIRLKWNPSLLPVLKSRWSCREHNYATSIRTASCLV